MPRAGGVAQQVAGPPEDLSDRAVLDLLALVLGQHALQPVVALGRLPPVGELVLVLLKGGHHVADPLLGVDRGLQQRDVLLSQEGV